MTQTAPALPAKLPFWSTIGEAYGFAFANLGQVARITGLWSAIALAVYAVLYGMLGGDELKAIQEGTSIGPASLNLISLLIGLVIGSSVAVAWHRFVLVGEKVTGAAYLRLDNRVWAYLGAAGVILAIGVPFLISLYVFMTRVLEITPKDGVPRADLDSLLIGLLPVIFITLAIACYFSTRLSLVLPARALGDDGYSWGDSWRTSRGHFWRLFAGSIVCYLPVLVAAWLGGVLTPDKPSITALVLSSSVMAVLGIILAVVPLGFLSVAYRHFTGAAPPTS